jgi:hypothetical protein
MLAMRTEQVSVIQTNAQDLNSPVIFVLQSAVADVHVEIEVIETMGYREGSRS